VLGSRGRWGGLLALGAFTLGCSDDASSGTLVVSEPTDDTTELRAHWPYTSFEVDVDLTLVTLLSPDGCVSNGTLTVDEALSAATHYTLAPTDCLELELTGRGDIVLHGEPTNHDWVSEALNVDTDKEVISLGPATGTNAEGEPETYTFTLSSPPCPDEPSCSCGVLRRTGGAASVELSLGKRC
jgi:hypothetical protein